MKEHILINYLFIHSFALQDEQCPIQIACGAPLSNYMIQFHFT